MFRSSNHKVFLYLFNSKDKKKTMLKSLVSPEHVFGIFQACRYHLVGENMRKGKHLSPARKKRNQRVFLSNGRHSWGSNMQGRRSKVSSNGEQPVKSTYAFYQSHTYPRSLGKRAKRTSFSQFTFPEWLLALRTEVVSKVLTFQPSPQCFHWAEEPVLRLLRQPMDSMRYERASLSGWRKIMKNQSTL